MSKTLQGHRTKFKKQRTEALTVSSCEQTRDTVQYSHDHLIIVKRQPKKYSLQPATEPRRDCAFVTDRLFLFAWDHLKSCMNFS